MDYWSKEWRGKRHKEETLGKEDMGNSCFCDWVGVFMDAYWEALLFFLNWLSSKQKALGLVLTANTIDALQGRLGRHRALFCPNEYEFQTHRSGLDYTKLTLKFTIDMADLAACLQSTSTAYGHQHYLTDFNHSLLVSTAPYSPRLHSSSLPSSLLFFICRGISLSQLDLIWNDLYFRALSSIYLRYLATLTCSTFASFTSYLDQGQEKQIHIRGKIQLLKFGVFVVGSLCNCTN